MDLQWTDDALQSPISITELVRIYDRLTNQLGKTQGYNSNEVASYASLWLTCWLLLQHASLSKEQLERVGETKEKCLLILQVFDMYTETPLDVLWTESFTAQEQDDHILWNVQCSIDLDKHALAKEETMLMEMANTPTPDENSKMLNDDSMQAKWSDLQAKIRQMWGESAYEKAQKESM